MAEFWGLNWMSALPAVVLSTQSGSVSGGSTDSAAEMAGTPRRRPLRGQLCTKMDRMRARYRPRMLG